MTAPWDGALRTFLALHTQLVCRHRRLPGAGLVRLAWPWGASVAGGLFAGDGLQARRNDQQYEPMTAFNSAKNGTYPKSHTARLPCFDWLPPCSTSRPASFHLHRTPFIRRSSCPFIAFITWFVWFAFRCLSCPP